MQFESQVLRFQQGTRSKNPAPDATIAAVQTGSLSQQGEQLAVLVDLNPLLPYRSREIRTLAVKTYWSSTGTIVARLRRALAAANRYLVNLNEEANASNKCTGSITCAVFAQDELFLGQVGAAHTYVLHGDNPDIPTTTRRFEVYPERKHLMIALGDALPPSIHISYTQLEVGSTVFLASTSIAESQARELWQQAMSMPALSAAANTISKAIENNHTSGTVIVTRALPGSQPAQTPQAESRRHMRRKAKMNAVPLEIVEAPVPAPAQTQELTVPIAPESPVDTEVDAQPVEQSDRGKWAQRLNRVTQGQAPTGTLLLGRNQTPPTETPVPDDDSEEEQSAHRHTRTLDGMEIDMETGEVMDQPVARSKRERRQTDIAWVGLWFKTFFAEMRRGLPEKPKELDKQQLRMALRSLLPEEQKAPAPERTHRTPPGERKPLLQGLLAGIILIIAVVTYSMNAQFGGPTKAQELEAPLQEVRNKAYNLQDQTSWEKVIREARGILALDESSIIAKDILEEAQLALQALEKAAILETIPLHELPGTMSQRKLLLADQTLVILDTTSDEVISFQLNDNYQSLKNPLPKTLLRRGQTVDGVTVGELIDIAWVPRGYVSEYAMIYVLGENGALFTHELSAATTADSAVFHVQQLQGDLAPGSISAMETFGSRIYLVNPPGNEILTFTPSSGNYSLSRLYLSVGAERDLINTYDLAIDQRVYLLTEDGNVKAYYDGVEDHSFSYDGVTDQPFSAQVITIEQSSNGSIVLGDPQAQRIALFSKRGRLEHLFRTDDNLLADIQSIAIAEDAGDGKAGVLFFISGNYLYAAPLPAFAQ